jgi:hypothetical protein
MFAYNSQSPISSVSMSGLNSHRVRDININRAHHLYQKVSLQGQVNKLLGRVIRRTTRLLDLNQFRWRLHQHAQYYAGIQAVNIDQIRGTLGKGSDFDVRFAPLNERTRSRWLKIAIARLQGTPLPAVELIQIGEIYFVVDGHHRISVARALGEQMIDAEITAWNLSGPLPWEKSFTPACLSSQPA